MIACSGLFYKPERAHFTAPPFKSNPLPLGFDLVLGVKLGGRHQYCYDIPRRSKGRFAPTYFFLLSTQSPPVFKKLRKGYRYDNITNLCATNRVYFLALNFHLEDSGVEIPKYEAQKGDVL